MKKKSVIRRVVAITGITITVLFAGLTIFTAGLVSASSQETADNDVQIIAESYASYVASWLAENLNLLEFYTKSDVIHNAAPSQEIGSWLATTTSRRSPEISYVLYIDAEGNSFYDNGNRGSHGDRDYFKTVMQGADSCITNPTLARATGIVSIMLVRAAYDRDGRKLGMFVGVKEISDIQEKIGGFTLGERGYALMLSGDGTAMCHPDPDMQMTANLLTESVAGHQDIAEVARSMTTGKTGSALVNSFVEPGTRDYVFYSPVENTYWSVAIGVPESQIEASSTQVLRILLACNIGITLTILAIIIILMLASLKPLREVSANINGIASGNADLTKRISVRNADEIGNVGLGFNRFIEKLQGIIGQVKDSRDALGTIDSRLQTSIRDTEGSIREILSNIDNVKAILTEQTSSVDSTAGAVTEITTSIQSLDYMIQTQAMGVAQASSATEQMIGNITAINSSIERMATEFHALQQKAELGAGKQRVVDEMIGEIESQSATLQEANVAISAIASQTNLLAMNAAIEAAHAGDAGKGFAVVADEIRKLSETSSSQTKTIKTQLQKIKASIESVVTSSAESSQAFSSVSSSIQQTEKLVREIRAAMEEQSYGSKQVLESLRDMSDSTTSVRSAAQEMNAGTKQILDEVSRLKDSSGSLNESVNAMNAGAGKINQTGLVLAEISSQMNISIQKIGSEIDQFRV